MNEGFTLIKERDVDIIWAALNKHHEHLVEEFERLTKRREFGAAEHAKTEAEAAHRLFSEIGERTLWFGDKKGVIIV